MTNYFELLDCQGQGCRKHSKSGGTCIQGHPQMQKRAQCKLKGGTLQKWGHVSLVSLAPMSMARE